ncbi:MAG: hypothetical protein ACREQ5_31050 [Candidatus Dormibacteria bacterium]
MPINLREIRDAILPALHMTPAQQAAAKQAYDRDIAEKAAKELAYYNSLTEEGKREYDDMSEGMMPRLPRHVESSWR